MGEKQSGCPPPAAPSPGVARAWGGGRGEENINAFLCLHPGADAPGYCTDARYAGFPDSLLLAWPIFGRHSRSFSRIPIFRMTAMCYYTIIHRLAAPAAEGFDPTAGDPGPGGGPVWLRLAAAGPQRIMVAPSQPRLLPRMGPSMAKFQLVSPFQPAGDQPQAIEQLVEGLRRGQDASDADGRHRLGQDVHDGQRDRPAASGPRWCMSHNKTLAAQLYGEFKEFFPHNAVHYFVSYYDYYQPEAYIPQRDIYIEKDASINEEIERLRLACHQRPGQPRRRDRRRQRLVHLRLGLARGLPQDDGPAAAWATSIDRDEMLLKFVDIQYDRNDVEFERGKFRVRGDVVELWPAYEEIGYRIELFGDEVERLAIDRPAHRRSASRRTQEMYIYPAKHFVLPEERIKGAVETIKRGAGGAAQAAARSRASCSKPSGWTPGRATTWRCCWRSATARGSRTTAGPSPAASRARRPTRCSTSFPPDSLLFVDESHVTVPQIRGMFAGDFSRKSTLVEHGFRLPSALDNRPLQFDEWEKKFEPAAVRLGHAGRLRGRDVRRRGRRAGDPADRPGRPGRPGRAGARAGAALARARSRTRAAAGERVLVTTLTKRLAEDLSRYLKEQGLRCKWLHSRARRLRAGRASSASCAKGRSTPWSASTCCARGSTCPRSRWSASSTPTRRASSGARPR